MTKILFTATVVKTHISAFHLPYIAWCKAQGYEVHVAARNDYGGQPCHIPGCDVYYDVPFARSPFSPENLRAYRQLKALIDANGYDIIHCNTPVAGALSRLASRKARKAGTKVVYTAHGFHFYTGAPLMNWLLYYPAEKFLARYTDVLITITKEDYERAQGKRFPAGKLVYVPGVGVSTARFAGGGDPLPLRRTLGLPGDGVLLICVGELNRNKNQRVILQAMAACRDEALFCALCGTGPEEGALRGLAAELGLLSRVRFLGFRTDMPQLYAAADVFCFPSLREGLSLSLLEAMSVGLPCVASCVRGNMELVQPGVNGYLHSPRDAAGFAASLAVLLKDPSLRNRMGARSRERVRAAYGLEQVLPQVCALYEACLAEKEGA